VSCIPTGVLRAWETYIRLQLDLPDISQKRPHRGDREELNLKNGYVRTTVSNPADNLEFIFGSKQDRPLLPPVTPSEKESRLSYVPSMANTLTMTVRTRKSSITAILCDKDASELVQTRHIICSVPNNQLIATFSYLFD
jgi:hypothetical protein